MPPDLLRRPSWPALLAICALVGCRSTIQTPPAVTGPSQSLYARDWRYVTNSGPPMPPGLTVRASSVSVRPNLAVPPVYTNGQVVCLTSPLGVVHCFTVTNSQTIGGYLIPFACDTNSHDHSVGQVTYDLKTWQDIPASAFGWSNYNPTMGTYLWGSNGQSTWLEVTNRTGMAFYREAIRP